MPGLAHQNAGPPARESFAVSGVHIAKKHEHEHRTRLVEAVEAAAGRVCCWASLQPISIAQLMAQGQ